jgi:hypothetical protein
MPKTDGGKATNSRLMWNKEKSKITLLDADTALHVKNNLSCKSLSRQILSSDLDVLGKFG